MFRSVEKYQEVENFLTSMKLDAYYTRKMLKENLYWEKEFLIQRAKEENIPYMEEYLNNFDVIRPKLGGCIEKIRGNPVLDTVTGIIYNSFRQVQIKMGIPYLKVIRFLETGRLKKLDKKGEKMISKVYIISFLNELSAGLRETTRNSRTKKIGSCKVKAEKTGDKAEDEIMFYIISERFSSKAKFDRLSTAKILFDLLKKERI